MDAHIDCIFCVDILCQCLNFVLDVLIKNVFMMLMEILHLVGCVAYKGLVMWVHTKHVCGG